MAKKEGLVLNSHGGIIWFMNFQMLEIHFGDGRAGIHKET